MARWETLIDYPNYVASDNGDIKKIEKDGSLTDVPKQFDNLGFQTVYLEKPNGIVTEEVVARIIGELFTPTTEWYQLECNNIKHKDGDLSNNCIENLEWVTEDDVSDDHHRQLYILDNKEKNKATRKTRKKKPVICKNVKTGVMLRFESQDEAELYLGVKNISPVLSGKQKTAAGYYICEDKNS